MTAARTRMTIDNGDAARLSVELEYTFSSGDTITLAFRPPMKEGEGIRELELRMLQEAKLRIEQMLALGA